MTDKRCSTYINDAVGACGQATLNQLIVLASIVAIQGAAKLVVDKVLPADWKPKDVHTQVLGEVLHLTNTTGRG